MLERTGPCIPRVCSTCPARSYDIVYSWGVLHHTGAMWRALEHVTTFVRPGGLLAVAIYRRSPACGFWQKEKRLYSSAPPPVRLFIRSLYKAAYLSAIAASGRNPFGYVFNYHNRTRGMSFHHDIHDWLGGYPYESASPEEIVGFMNKHGLSRSTIISTTRGSERALWFSLRRVCSSPRRYSTRMM